MTEINQTNYDIRLVVAAFGILCGLTGIIACSMLVLSVIGVNDMALLGSMSTLAALMVIPILLMIFGGLAQQIQSLPLLRTPAELLGG